VTYTVTSSFDAGGRLLSRTYPDTTRSGTHAYNAAGQLITVTGAITGTTYNAQGQVLTISYANGVATTYGYSATRGWLNTVSSVKTPTTIEAFTYSRDNAGRITAIDGNRSDEDFAYGYDSLDRLLTATNSGVPALSQTFAYDLAGDLITNSAVGADAYPTSRGLTQSSLNVCISWSVRGFIK
jgi:hypothetical protein